MMGLEAYALLAKEVTASSAWEQQKRNMADNAPEPSACENCGSSEYQHHHGRLICSYCRSAPYPAPAKER